MEITPELAEICGIHVGDGYLRGPDKRAELDISGNLEEKGYYDNAIKELFKKVFGVEISCKLFVSRNTYGFVIRDRKIIKFMHDLGFPYGNKSTIIRIPDEILNSQNREILASFLRGYFDTDGCVHFKKRGSKESYSTYKRDHHYYPVISFSTVSKELHENLNRILNKVGFTNTCQCVHLSKVPGENVKYITILYGRDKVNKFFQEIGSKNPVKSSRYLVWKKLGHCPANTSLKQREEMLKSTAN